ncbi:MAG: hypothetical protein ING69_10725 [Rhodocyclaceae bacterium]|nr:hypothetical protein [Rhodocyclaceae bacterium]
MKTEQNLAVDTEIFISAYIGKWFVRDDLGSGTIEIIGKGYLHETRVPGSYSPLKLPLLAPPLTLTVLLKSSDDKGFGSITAYAPEPHDYHIDVRAAVDQKQMTLLREDILSNRQLPKILRMPAKLSVRSAETGGFEPASEEINGTISEIGWLRPAAPIEESIRYDAFVEDMIKLRTSFHTERESWCYAFSQFQRVYSQLAISAINKALHEGLEITAARTAVTELTRDLIGELVRIESDTRKAKKAAGIDISNRSFSNIEWKKRNPNQDYRRGKKSENWAAIQPGDLENFVEEYVASGLRSAVVEQILVDAMIYCETKAYAESVAEQAPGLKRDSIGLSHEYHEEHGDLDAIAAKKRWRVIPKVLFGFVLWIVFPIFAALVAAAEHGFAGVTYIAGLWIGAVFLLPKLSATLGIGETARKEMEAHTKRIETLMAMINAYKDLGEDVHPSRLLRSLNKAADLGAVWNSGAIALLVRADRQNADDWVRNRHGDKVTRTCMRVIKDYYAKIVESGVKVQMPSLESEL